MKKILSSVSTIIIIVMFSATLFAQNENDALRYSLINYGGTARFSALSGAYGAVGADFSSLSQNPAGIALYRKSEFSITPVLFSNNTTADFLTQTNSDSRNALHLGSVGYVYSKNMNGRAGSLVQLNFGFGVNMMSSFNNRIALSGYNDNNSLLTTYVDQVNTSGQALADWSNYGAGLAYDVHLIYDDSTNQRYASEAEYGGVQQTKYVETYGSTNETVLSAGANIADKLFLGVTFAFPYIRYHEVSTFTETDKNEIIPYFKSFDKREYLDTKGSGFNFKAGLIFMPVEFFRIGGSIHTPTNYYNMSDNYNAAMNSYFDNGDNFSKNPTEAYFEYKIKTPLRATGSVAFILGKYGLISADYEYIDYSTANLRASDYSFSSENNAIRSQYTAANNFRVGGEFKAGVVALRGGYNFYGSPYKGAGSMGSRNGYSFGLGFRDKGYFMDFAYNHSQAEAIYYLYNIESNRPESLNTLKTNAFSLTFGFRF